MFTGLSLSMGQMLLLALGVLRVNLLAIALALGRLRRILREG